jgi:hypothetical protein
MESKIALYPIVGVTPGWLDEPFDLTTLPATVVPDVTVENVEPLFDEKAFDLFDGFLAKRELESMKRIRFAIVCRYADNFVGIGEEPDTTAERVVRYLGACLRLIRPMQQDASFVRGRILPDSRIQIQHFENPHEMAVPAVQKLFRLRNKDVVRLQRVAPQFLAAMAGDFWKFRIAVELHESGHFSHAYWKGRFSLWCSALEALFTSDSYEHKGTLVAKERIKWFLGPKALIYEPGDIQTGQPEPTIAVEDLIDDLYELRNSVAHGDKTRNKFFDVKRTDYDQNVVLAEVLSEAISRIIRASLLRILEDNLLNEFANGPASEAYFGSQGLTRSKLYARRKAAP